jgi:dimethylglycine dehydrogenase
VGRIPGKRNAWCITGLRAGLGEGGGHGWLLAQQIVHGEACYDTWCIDPRRFTRHANVEFTALKAVEDYQNEFRFHMPHEWRPAGRPAKTTSLYLALEAAGASFGVVNGWERAAYYKPSPGFHETHSFRFNNTFDIVGEEVRAVHQRVGLMEVNGFNRFEISGRGVHDWLDGIVSSNVPRKAGKVGLTYLLNAQGNVKGEATLANVGDNRVWYGSAAASEYHDMDWLRAHLPADGSIRIESLTNSHTILVVAGPLSRQLMQKVAPRTDWSKQAFPWLTCKPVYIGHHEALAMSVSFSGELAYELHIPNAFLLGAYQTIVRAGKEFGLAHFGVFATESMRLEKSYRHWKADLITEFNPFESGLGRFVRMDKNFIGRDALAKMQDNAPRRSFVTMEVHSTEASPHPGDSVVSGGKVIGTISSAAWGYRVGKNLAMAFIDPAYAETGTEVAVSFLGADVNATIIPECQYDPANTRMRA